MHQVACTVAVLSFASALLPAQFPSDEEVKKQLWNDLVHEIRFPRKTGGEKIWDASSNSWYWQRGVVVVRDAKLKEYPKATVEIGGLARYFITGGKVSYQKFLVTWNEYKGIPAPDHAATVKMVRERLRAFVGNYRYQKIVGGIEDLRVAKDHRTEWHTAHSFSINLCFGCKMIVSNTDVEAQDLTIRVRFYRDGFGKPWREGIVTTVVETKRGARTKHDIDEVRAMPTLGRIAAEKAALAARAALPQVKIPKFGSDMDVFRFVYKLLREGDAKTFEAGLSQCLAPHFYSNAQKKLLNGGGVRLIQTAVKRAYGGKSTYKENYGPEMTVKRQQRNMIELWNRTKRVKTRIAVGQFEDPETGDLSWGVIAVEPWTLTRRADILRLRRLLEKGK